MKNFDRYLARVEEAKKEYPTTICTYKTFTYRCTREKYKDTDYCIWHLPDDSKFDAENCSDFFLGDNTNEAIKNALETEIQEGRSLEGAYLRGLWLSHLQPIFDGGNFTDADMQGFHFGYGSVKGCTFLRANLESAYFSDCELDGADFRIARLHNAKFRFNDFSNVIGLNKESFFGFSSSSIFPSYNINDNQHDNIEGVCADNYRKLKLYFNERGNYDDASWAAYKEKVMHRRDLKRNLSYMSVWIHSTTFDRNISDLHRFRLCFAKSILNRLKYMLSIIYSILFGYGEKPLRVVAASIATILGYSIIYRLFSVLKDSSDKVVDKFIDSLYFSIVTFTTLGYGDLTPLPEFRLVAASEAVLGAFLMGLFLFTLSRRAIGRT